MTGYMRRSRLARLLADAELDEAMRKATRVVYCCPTCQTACEEDGTDGLWCPGCQAAVSLADMHADRESDPWF